MEDTKTIFDNIIFVIIDNYILIIIYFVSTLFFLLDPLN